MTLTACVSDATIDVTVSDIGRGLRPRIDSPGAGLGLPLIAQMADSMTMRCAPGSGTELRMSFRLKR